MKNAKHNNANLYSNFSPRYFKSYFLTGGAMAPPGPPLESPMFMMISVWTNPTAIFILIGARTTEQSQVKHELLFCARDLLGNIRRIFLLKNLGYWNAYYYGVIILYYHHHTPNIIKKAFFTELLKNGMNCHHLVMTNSWTNIYKSIYIIGCISAHCCLSNII